MPSLTPQMLAQALAKPVKEVNGDRVPYLAGMNRQGSKLFFSKDFPKSINIAGQPVDPKPFVTIHEEVETELMKHGMSYAGAHEIATKYEHAAVTQAGHNPADYEKALKPFINEAHYDHSGQEPSDLNQKPYKS